MRQGRLHAPPGSYRPRCSADISSDRHVPSQGERLDGVFAIKHNHKIGYIRANLETPAKPTSRDAGRGGPRAIGKTSDYDTRTGFAGKDETCFEDLEYR